MSERYEVCWDWSDDGNAAHIAEHDVTPDEVEHVLRGRWGQRSNDASHPGRWIVVGFTDARLPRYLKVVFEIEWVAEWGCWAVYPVTAFEPD